MRRLLTIALILGVMFTTGFADAGSWGGRGGGGHGGGRGGGSRGWSGWSGGAGGGRYAAPAVARARAVYYAPAARRAAYYQPSYQAAPVQTYYVPAYAAAVRTVTVPSYVVASAPPTSSWLPPPPTASGYVPPEAEEGDWQAAPSAEEGEQNPAQAAAEDKTGTLVIAIGTNYSERTDIPHLKYAASDTRKVYDALCARQPGPGTGVLLVGRHATRKNILDAIDQAKEWEGPVLFYFSGHGSPDLTGGEKLGYLVASDTDLSYPARLRQTALSVSDIWAQLQDSPAQSVFAAVDICFTGTGKSVLTEGAKPLIVSGGGPEQAPGYDDPVVADGAQSSRVLLLSSSANQPSWEDGKRLKGGIFTHYLIAGLTEAAGANNTVGVQKLVRYVKREVKAAARRLKGVDQTPQSFGEGEFVVAGSGALPEGNRSARQLVSAGKNASGRQSYAQ